MLNYVKKNKSTCSLCFVPLSVVSHFRGRVNRVQKALSRIKKTAHFPFNPPTRAFGGYLSALFLMKGDSCRPVEMRDNL